MARLFVGIPLPSSICDRLLTLQSGLPGARWRPRDNLHVTLAFIGEMDSHGESEIADALVRLEAPAFDIRVEGIGHFGKRRPHTLWAGVDEAGELSHLAGKVANTLKQIGVKIENRKYTPHVTIANVRNARRNDVNEFVGRHGDFVSDPFYVDRFVLYQSHMGKGASHYVSRAEFALAAFPQTFEEPRLDDDI